MDHFSCIWVLFLTLKVSITVSCVRLKWSCYEETGSCYYVADVKLVLSEASCWCQAASGHLLRVDTDKEWSKVAEYIDKHTDTMGFWVEATTKNNDTKFTWADETPASLPWFMWSTEPPEPQWDKGEHCAIISHVYWWATPPTKADGIIAFNLDCSERRQFICERKNI